MPMFFNQPYRRTPNQMYQPFFPNFQNNFNPNLNRLPDFSNPNRPFADEAMNKPEQIIIPKIDSKISDGLCQFMQNEKNASKYYEKLAEKTNVEKNKKILYTLSQNAVEELNYTRKICSSLSINITEPIDKSVNTLVTFNGGIALALEEENKSLNELALMIESDNNDINNKLTPIILRKLSRVNNLYLIYTNL